MICSEGSNQESRMTNFRKRWLPGNRQISVGLHRNGVESLKWVTHAEYDIRRVRKLGNIGIEPGADWQQRCTCSVSVLVFSSEGNLKLVLEGLFLVI